MIASIALAASMSSATINALGGDQEMLQLLPLSLASIGLVCSLIGILMVRLFRAVQKQRLDMVQLGLLYFS